MKKRTWMFFLSSLLALTVVALAFAHLQPSTTHAAAPAKKFPVAGMKPYGHFSPNVINGKLTYHNGPVMAGTANAYLIFWEPTGSVVTPAYNHLLKRYFSDVGNSPLYHNNTQYTDSSSNSPSNAILADQFLDTNPYPGNPMTDGQVQAEVTRVMNLKGWTASIDNIFFVFTAEGEHNATADQNSFCAYHNVFSTNTIYAAMVYPTVLAGCLVPLPSPNNDQIADSEIDISSHEQMESATDPLLNAWYHVDLGHEIGDECNFVLGRRNASGGDVSWHGEHFLVQKEWDNTKRGCVLNGP